MNQISLEAGAKVSLVVALQQHTGVIAVGPVSSARAFLSDAVATLTTAGSALASS